VQFGGLAVTSFSREVSLENETVTIT